LKEEAREAKTFVESVTHIRAEREGFSSAHSLRDLGGGANRGHRIDPRLENRFERR
jgi:hypothetical protein